jgi:hypothetical protein
MAADQPPIEELRSGTYIKSSYSPEQQNCVRVGRVGAWIGMQDEKEYTVTAPEARTTLGFTPAEFAAFLQGAKDGEFDHLIA